MSGLADWLLPAIGLTVLVVLIAAVVALRGTTTPRRTRPIDTSGPDLREHAARLAGQVADAFTSLAAMDALAERHPEHGPAVVALLAEHLRAHSASGDDAVTQAVHRCLASQARALTRAPGPGGEPYLDLGGAHLRDLDLSHLRVRGLSLAHARLEGTTRISGLRCSGDIDATAALFDGDLVADDLYVDGDLRLARSVITNLDLTGSFVQGITDLSAVQVTGSAWLTGSVLPAIRLFASGPGAETATFTGPVDLQRVVCDDITLYGSEFQAGLTITINQDEDIGRGVAARDPATVEMVRRALFYDLGASRPQGWARP